MIAPTCEVRLTDRGIALVAPRGSATAELLAEIGRRLDAIVPRSAPCVVVWDLRGAERPDAAARGLLIDWARERPHLIHHAGVHASRIFVITAQFLSHASGVPVSAHPTIERAEKHARALLERARARQGALVQ